jgi:hypothetical protein
VSNSLIVFNEQGAGAALTLSSTNAATFTGDVNLFRSGSDRILYVSKGDGTSTIQLNSNGNSYFNGGNVGIGTSSPAYLLDLWSTSATLRIRNITAPATGGTSSLLFEGINNFSGTSQSFINSIQAGNSGATQLTFGTSGTSDATATERMRITSGGYLLLGTTTATYGQAGRGTFEMNGSTDNILVQKVGGSLANYLYSNASNTELYSTNFLQVSVNGSERMRITSGGSVLLNQSSTLGAEILEITPKIFSGGQYGIIINGNPASYSNFAMRFNNVGTAVVGSITFTTTATLYNVTSDYRLKQDFKDFIGLDLVSAIKTYDYEWKLDKSRMYGVVAHELAEVLPYAVTGEKDAEEMQSVDYSKIVPILVKAIQEQQAQIEELKELIKNK